MCSIQICELGSINEVNIVSTICVLSDGTMSGKKLSSIAFWHAWFYRFSNIFSKNVDSFVHGYKKK